MNSGAKQTTEGSAKANNENCKIFRDDSWISQFSNCSNPWMARYVYGMMFLVANLLAWAARDYAHGPLIEMEGFNRCHGKGDCRGTEGVLRVSLGCFISVLTGPLKFLIHSDEDAEIQNLFPKIFFIIMFFSTVGTSKLNQPRNIWHSGWWCTKIMLLIFLGFFPFVVPSPFIQLYGEVAHFGAGVFLLIQLISVISFITWLNDWCESKKYAEKCHIHVMLLATIAYLICLVGIILMYIWYVPEPSCLLNIFFITWTLVLLQLMTSVSLHPKVNAGFLTPGLMGLYVVFICWCAIRSEPAGGSCNRKAEASKQTDWLTIISFIVALLAMVIATFSTGIDSQCFQFRKKDLPDEDDVPYGYGFFHFVFATGAMYFAMLLIGWNAHHPMKKWTIDVGWTSTWVRIVNEWLAVCVYLWMLLSPLVWKSAQVGNTP